MSNPARKVRQPGRTAQGHNKPDCGLCSNGAPGPIGLVVHGLNSTGSCCIEPFDNGGAAMPLTADTGNCGRSNGSVGPYFCSYTYNQSFISTPFVWTVDISCESDGAGGFRAHVHVALDEILSGGTLHNIAYGDWFSASFPSCGNFDCSFVGDVPGGTLTVTDVGGGWCTPGNCGSPTWGLNTGGVNPCAQPAAKNCCCGGQPPPPCFFICIQDDVCGQIDIAVCRRSDGHYGGENGEATASMTYNPSTGWTISYTCSGGGGSITIGPSDPGWTKQNGGLHLSGSGSGFSLNAGTGPQCGTTSAACGPHCADGSFPTANIFADLTGSALTNNTCGCCGDVAAIWGLDASGNSAVSGCSGSVNYGCWNTLGAVLCGSGNCHNEDQSPCSDWTIQMRADVCDAGAGHWRWTFAFGIFISGNSFNSTLCGTCFGDVDGSYLGPIMNDGDPCDLSTPVTLTLVSSGMSTDPRVACLGALPATVTLFT